MITQRIELSRFTILVLLVCCSVSCIGTTEIEKPTLTPLTIIPTIDNLVAVVSPTATATLQPSPDVLHNPPHSTAVVSPTATATLQPKPASTPSHFSLPINREIPPSEIQSQVRWSDAGFGDRGPWAGCQSVDRDSTSNVQVVSTTHLEGPPFYEGESIAICAWDLPWTSMLNWSLETTTGDIIDEGKNNPVRSNVNILSSNAEFLPEFSYTSGTYKFRIVFGTETIETEFEILPAPSPTIWTIGTPLPGRTLQLYYAGFEPGEVITTVWFTTVWYVGAPPLSSYLTSWQTIADATGATSESVLIPEDFCINSHLFIEAIGQNPQKKSYGPDAGWGMDIFASAETWVSLALNCEEEPMEPPEPQIIDNSSRFLKQVDMGIIGDGEKQFGTLISIMEAHNWRYEATPGTLLSIQVEFLNNTFPIDRISILDPNGRLVYECADTVRGCSSNQDINYLTTFSGTHTIRIDMFNEGDGTYSLFVKSTRDGTLATLNEIIIDDSDTGMVLHGPSGGWRTAPYGYQESTHWTYCTDGTASNWAQWSPELPINGNYGVFAFIPEHKAGTTQAQYSIFHNGQPTEVVVQQANYANEWVKLGTFWFAADGEEYVSLSDDTGEPRSKNVTIAFDAIKFVYVP